MQPFVMVVVVPVPVARPVIFEVTMTVRPYEQEKNLGEKRPPPLNGDRTLRGVRLRKAEQDKCERLRAEIASEFGERITQPATGSQSWASKGQWAVRY